MRLQGIKISKIDTSYIIECQLDDERLYFESSHTKNNQSDDLFYDPFVIALLPLMLERKENLFIEGAVDSVLLNQLNLKVLPKLCKIHHIYEQLTITALICLENKAMKSNLVATGISCGVDSLATIKEFKESDKKLDFLTFFDAGSHGAYGAKNTKATYCHRLKNANVAAEKIGLNIINVRTNAHSFLKGYFKSAHSFLNLSCAFATLGFINEYHYASAYSINQSNQRSGDTSNFDHYILPELYASYFSSKSTLGNKNRLERIQYIINYNISKKHLDVCTNSLRASEIGALNCTSCEKCMRTATTINLIDNLKNYKKVFELKQFKMNQKSYVVSLLLGNNSTHDNELLNLLKSANKIRLIHKIMALKMVLKKKLKSLLALGTK